MVGDASLCLLVGIMFSACSCIMCCTQARRAQFADCISSAPSNGKRQGTVETCRNTSFLMISVHHLPLNGAWSPSNDVSESCKTLWKRDCDVWRLGQEFTLKRHTEALFLRNFGSKSLFFGRKMSYYFHVLVFLIKDIYTKATVVGETCELHIDGVLMMICQTKLPLSKSSRFWGTFLKDHPMHWSQVLRFYLCFWSPPAPVRLFSC